MSKEYERFKKQLPQRELFFVRCASHAFRKFPKLGRHNWLRVICESEEHLRESILLGFVKTLAKDMAKAEYDLKPGRGRRPKLEEIEEKLMVEAEREIGELTTPQAVMKTGVARTQKDAIKKAKAMKSWRYREKRKNVTK